MAGAVVQWLRDGLGLIAHAREIEALAGSRARHRGVYLGARVRGARRAALGRRRARHHRRSDARRDRAHIARAALDAIAFQCADVLAAMQQDAAQPLRELRVDGGARPTTC